MRAFLKSDQITTVKSILKSFPAIVGGYVFGSRVKGKGRKDSDLDIGILCFSKKGISPLEIAQKLFFLNDKNPLDLVLLDLTDDPLLLIQVINGQCIYQNKTLDRIKLETRILHLYEDSRHLKKIKDYYLSRSFKEGIYAH